MCYSGVCSISFRENTVDEIIRATKEAELDGIEWGSDVHVRPNDKKNAKLIRQKMDEAGLKTLSYGTYFGITEMKREEFLAYMETADILGTDILRIWPPCKNRAQISKATYEQYVAFTREMADIAKQKGKVLCLERHPNMLTEHAYEAKQFIEDVGMDNLRMYWQPIQFVDEATNLQSAVILEDIVENVHVFQWRGENRYPLQSGIDEWKQYFKIFEKRGMNSRAYLLEFMPENRLEELKENAAILRVIMRNEQAAML